MEEKKEFQNIQIHTLKFLKNIRVLTFQLLKFMDKSTHAIKNEVTCPMIK